MSTMLSESAMCQGSVIFSVDSYCRPCEYNCVLFQGIIVLDYICLNFDTL